MTRYLEGKVAIVTGSGQGIGRAIAAALAEQGAAVVTNNRRPGATSTTQLTPERLSKLTEEERNWVAEEMQRFGGDAESTAEMIRQRGGKAGCDGVGIGVEQLTAPVMSDSAEHRSDSGPQQQRQEVRIDTFRGYVPHVSVVDRDGRSPDSPDKVRVGP